MQAKTNENVNFAIQNKKILFENHFMSEKAFSPNSTVLILPRESRVNVHLCLRILNRTVTWHKCRVVGNKKMISQKMMDFV